MPKQLRFGIVGVGPTGGIMAVHLASAGYSVVLVDKIRSHMDCVKDRGLVITGFKDLKATFPSENIHYSVKELSPDEFDVLFIAVKASVMVRVIQPLKSLLKPGTTVISLQNGMDTETILGEAFGGEDVMRVVVNYAGNLIEDGKIRFSFFSPPNYIGAIDRRKQSRAEEIAKVMTESGLDTEFAPDIRKRVWQKVIMNCGLSAICALTRKTMKQMMDCDITRSLVVEVLKESIAVAEASGVDLPEGFLETSVKYLDRAGHHQTSMYIDILKDNPTEIDFINGKVVEYGSKAKIGTPCNATIVSLIKGMQVELPEPPLNPENRNSKSRLGHTRSTH